MNKTSNEVPELSAAEIAALPYRPNVGVVLINDAGLIWGGLRAAAGPNDWQMPQGGIDEGEDPLPAALRELEEETGIAPDLVAVVGETADWIRYDLPYAALARWKFRWRGQKQKWFLMRYKGTDADINIDVEHREFDAWTWMTPTALEAAIIEFKKPVYRHVFNEFKLS